MPARIDFCPKGWGSNIVFTAQDTCPISGAINCVRCELKAKTPDFEEDSKKLKEGQTE